MGPLSLILMLALLIWDVYFLSTMLAAWGHACRHGPDEIDVIDIPVEWGLDTGVWCMCRRCGVRIVLTRARLRQLDLE